MIAAYHRDGGWDEQGHVPAQERARLGLEGKAFGMRGPE
jgi:hypothetical protein